MKKSVLICFVFILIGGFCSTNAFALQSAKATAQFTDVTGASLGMDWVTVLSQEIKTANMKDLFIDASFEVGLTTNTAVMSRKLERAIAEADAKVEVRVLLDGGVVAPGEVTFSKRNQKLIAEFAGLYDLWDANCVQIEYACVDQDPSVEPDADPSNGCDTGTQVITAISFSEENTCFDPEFLQLILSTMAAHSFNFIAADVPVGDHVVEVQVKLTYDEGDGVDILDDPYLEDAVNAGAWAGSTAWVGKGSVTIESVRMIKGEDVEAPLID